MMKMNIKNMMRALLCVGFLGLPQVSVYAMQNPDQTNDPNVFRDGHAIRILISLIQNICEAAAEDMAGVTFLADPATVIQGIPNAEQLKQVLQVGMCDLMVRPQSFEASCAYDAQGQQHGPFLQHYFGNLGTNQNFQPLALLNPDAHVVGPDNSSNRLLANSIKKAFKLFLDYAQRVRHFYRTNHTMVIDVDNGQDPISGMLRALKDPHTGIYVSNTSLTTIAGELNQVLAQQPNFIDYDRRWSLAMLKRAIIQRPKMIASILCLLAGYLLRQHDALLQGGQVGVYKVSEDSLAFAGYGDHVRFMILTTVFTALFVRLFNVCVNRK